MLSISAPCSLISFHSIFLQSRNTRRPMERLSKVKPPSSRGGEGDPTLYRQVVFLFLLLI